MGYGATPSMPVALVMPDGTGWNRLEAAACFLWLHAFVTRETTIYRRLKGTDQFLGFYDVLNDCLAGVFRKRARRSNGCASAIRAKGYTYY